MSQIDSYSEGKGDIGAASVGNEADVEIRCWRSRLAESSAKSRKIRGSNYVQLATVDPETGLPKCRTVVFRGFQSLPSDHKYALEIDGVSCVMKMVTDARSQKVRQASSHPQNAAEMVWWFPRSSEQYRIQGTLLFVGSKEFNEDSDGELLQARREMWGNLSDAARESFFVSQVPGEAFSAETSTIPPGGRDGEGKLLPPPENFLLMLLRPNTVDYLRLKDNYHQVDRLAESEWKATRLNA